VYNFKQFPTLSSLIPSFANKYWTRVAVPWRNIDISLLSLQFQGKKFLVKYYVCPYLAFVYIATKNSTSF